MFGISHRGDRIAVGSVTGGNVVIKAGALNNGSLRTLVQLPSGDVRMNPSPISFTADDSRILLPAESLNTKTTGVVMSIALVNGAMQRSFLDLVPLELVPLNNIQMQALISWAMPSLNMQMWLRSAGGEVKRVTNDVNDYSSLSATTDGKTIVGIQSAGHFEVLAGNRPADLTSVANLSGSPVQVSWFDSKHVAWIDVDGALRLVTPNGQERRVHLNDRLVTTRIATCGDGRHVVLERISGAGKPVEIWHMNADGTGLRRLSNDADARDPKCSHGGEVVVYTTYRHGEAKLNRISADGKASSAVVTAPYALPDSTETNAYDSGSPGFSPDGSTFALTAYDSTGNPFLLLFDPSLYKIKRVLKVPRGASDWHWTFNSKAVTFSSHMDSNGNINRLDLATGKVEQVTHFTVGHVIMHDWASDGKLLVEKGDYLADAVQFTVQ